MKSEKESGRAMQFDPDAAAKPGSGVFGLPEDRGSARIILLPVPYDATTSYGGGASGGPAAIMNASRQVDLYDLQFGRVYEAGLYMEEASEEVRALSIELRQAAASIIEKGGADPSDAGDMEIVARVDAGGERVNAIVHEATARVLAEGKVPGLVGGDHSTPFGAIRACAERFGGAEGGLGVLQIDAHMDLRDAFEGFQWSHASITHNVLERVPQVSRVVQVGIRDVGEKELTAMRRSGDRVIAHFDLEWSKRLDAEDAGRGFKGFQTLCEEAIVSLPRHVYVTFDIDGLDPSLCPHTGTPVPGGLSFNRACVLLETLWRSGRTIVGFDLCEVCPCPSGEDEWDANVGARLLYKMCGMAGMRV